MTEQVTTKKNSKKIIKRLDERLCDFLFGHHQGYLWGQRCQTDAQFKRLLLTQGGFVDVHIESRLLYDELIPFTIFQTPYCEIAFNQLCWQAGNLQHNYLRNADLFLFRNQQRLISVSVNHAAHILPDHDCVNHYRVSDSEIHWTQQNIWLNDYIDFIQRIESLLQQLAPLAPALSSKDNHSAAYQLGYRLAKWLYRQKNIPAIKAAPCLSFAHSQ